MITDRLAADLIDFIRQLWPKWDPPEFQVGELADWMVRRLTDVGFEQCQLAINAEAEEQQSKQFSKSQPVVKSLKRRLGSLQSDATGQRQDRTRLDPETQHGESECVWGQCEDGQFAQGGYTARQWADSHDRLAAFMLRTFPKNGEVLARRCQVRADRLRDGEFLNTGSDQ